MKDLAIRVENLSKRYQIGNTSSGSLRETITNMVRTDSKSKTQDFWALRDINFEVKKGEALGIIGKNGAGKSTLLKLLSRISEPTKGRVEIEGRISSLLEVGTGFHPELTGRENIFLNGTVLGMKRQEIKDKFDEIVDFSGVEKFLDTPVKRYSSGMKVRLAFAVAAHLEPEIMIIDEVLAVGDFEFQKKCLGKMEDVTGQGRTVIFVSHNMAAVSSICSRGILLKSGRIVLNDTTENTIKQYLKENKTEHVVPIAERSDRKGNGTAQFMGVVILDASNEAIKILQSGGKYVIRIKMKNNNYPGLVKNVILNIGVNDDNDNRITFLSNEITGQVFDIDDEFINIDIAIDKLPLPPGTYNFTFFAKSQGVITDWIQNAYYFEVEQGDYYNTGKLPPSNQGVFYADHSFKLASVTT